MDECITFFKLDHIVCMPMLPLEYIYQINFFGHFIFRKIGKPRLNFFIIVINYIIKYHFRIFLNIEPIVYPLSLVLNVLFFVFCNLFLTYLYFILE